MAPNPASLQALESEVWGTLAAAVRDRLHPWRTPVLATVDGDAADARTVVLREVDATARELLIYTDARSGKVAQLQRHPEGTLVMWSAALGWQLRCRVQLELEASGLAVSSRWARIRLSPAAQDYLSPLPPGSPLDTPDLPTHEAVTREHFAIVLARVRSIDWLALHADGHRRARFDDAGARWLQP